MEIKSSILVIDDEDSIRKFLEISLKGFNYHVQSASTAKGGKSLAIMHPPDLIILDLGLPDEDGQTVLVKLREWYLGAIIILSVRSSEEEIIKALDNGANDFLTKPFRTGELLARIRTALRHSKNPENIQKLEFDNLIIDLTNHLVTVSNEIIKLTATEYSLLCLFAKNEGRVLTHQFLLKQIWGPCNIEQSHNLRVYIGYLRKKIEPNPDNPIFIITETGIGYRFCSPKNSE